MRRQSRAAGGIFCVGYHAVDFKLFDNVPELVCDNTPARPTDYVTDPDVRLQVYRRLADVRTPSQVREMARELRDRFGEPPEPAQALLDLLRLKTLALRVGVCDIRSDRQRIIVVRTDETPPNLDDLPEWLRRRLRARGNILWLDREGLGDRWSEVLRRVLLALGRSEEEDA